MNKKEFEKLNFESFKNAIQKEWISTETEKNVTDKFYHKSWFVIMMLYFFCPVGLYLMWKHKKFTGKWRIILTTIATAFLVYCACADSGDYVVSTTDSSASTINITSGIDTGTATTEYVSKAASDDYSRGEFEDMCIEYIKDTIENDSELREYYKYKKVKEKNAYSTPVCGSYDYDTFDEIKENIDYKLKMAMKTGKYYGASKAHIYAYLDKDNRNMLSLLVEAVE